MDLVESYRDELRFTSTPLARTFLVALVGALVALPWITGPAVVVRGTLVWLYAIAVLGQNLLIGYAGLLSFGQAGFLAVGAYSFAHLYRAGIPFPLAVAAGGLAAAVAGAVVGFPSLRLKGPYLAIATLGFGIAAYQVVANAQRLSGGRSGLPIPRLTPLPGLSRDLTMYYGYLALLALFCALTFNLVSSYLGRAFAAIRDSELAAECMGVNLTRYKLLAFVISSFYTGVAGALLAEFLGHLEPQTFNLGETVNLIVAAIVGGLASVEGAVLGAAFVVVLPAILAGARWAVPTLSGTALIAVLLFERDGLAGVWRRVERYFRTWPLR